jgi:hypothetical protein
MGWFHDAVTFFILAGGFLSSNVYYLKAHFFFCGCIILQWLVNDNRCVLSEKEYDDKNGYTKQLLGYVGITVPDDDCTISNCISYGSTMLSMAFSYWRFSGSKTANVIVVTEVPPAPASAKVTEEQSTS